MRSPAPLATILARIQDASARAGQATTARLLAVSKQQPASAVVELAAAGQTAFGENYVQEAAAKQTALGERARAIEWHLIGHLQSNKCRQAARLFDWVQSVDRMSVVTGLAAARDPTRPPLNVLIQVNIDDEASKSGCAPAQIEALAAAIRAAPALRLRGLMAIPAPHPDLDRRAQAFDAMHALFLDLRRDDSQVDTLSLGMSDDFEQAIAHGATMVRVGSALFGPRVSADPDAGYPARP